MKTIHWLISIQGFLIVCVNGGYWNAWERWVFGACSETCGGGTQVMSRKRTCHVTYVHTSHGWFEVRVGCSSGSSKSENIINCNIFPCPVNGGWGMWTNAKRVGLCSITCGVGMGSISMYYARACINPVPQYGGRQCEGQETKYTKEDCTATIPCTVVAAGWGEWNIHSIGPCTATCGTGTKQIVRKRLCDNPPPKRGAEDCFGNSMQFITKSCDEKIQCKVHGGWSVWTRKSTALCSVTCGSGQQLIHRHRFCNNPVPKNGGRMCFGDSLESKLILCIKTVVCAVDGGWGDWIKDSEGECSVTCGSGTKQVSWTRICDNPKPSSGGQPCVGNSSVTAREDCNTGTPCKDLLSNSVTEIASPQESSETNTGAIAGSVVGVFIAVCLVAVGVFFFRKSQRNKPDAVGSTSEKDNNKTDQRDVTTQDNPAFVADKLNAVK